MPIPTSLSDLSTDQDSNYPRGGESPVTADNYLRAHAALLAQLRDITSAPPPLAVNLWINSDFGVNQRALTSVADGAYCLDRTYVLTETGNVGVSQLAQPTDGIPYALRLTQPDAVAKRIGFAQAVEARNCLAYRGGNLVFAPKLRSSAGGNMRVALLAHTGTADAITRDIVNSWASGVYTPANFFIAGLTVIAVGSAAVAANTWTDVAVSSASTGGIAAPSGMNNLIMVAWTEAQQAQNATLDASVVRAGTGAQVPVWTPPDAAVELARCRRYCQLVQGSFSGLAVTSTSGEFNVPLLAPMRAVPTMTNVANGNWVDGVGASSVSGATLAGGYAAGPQHVSFTTTGLGAAPRPVHIVGQSLLFSAEL